uniref:Uncharacterized protein n=1 Tax=Oryza punctata TaxID=4537 RepID=A0A0E0LF82_ORYPU
MNPSGRHRHRTSATPLPPLPPTVECQVLPAFPVLETLPAQPSRHRCLCPSSTPSRHRAAVAPPSRRPSPPSRRHRPAIARPPISTLRNIVALSPLLFSKRFLPSPLQPPPSIYLAAIVVAITSDSPSPVRRRGDRAPVDLPWMSSPPSSPPPPPTNPPPPRRRSGRAAAHQASRWVCGWRASRSPTTG